MIRKYRPEDTEAIVSIWRSASELAHSFLGEEFLKQEAVELTTQHLSNAETWVLEHDGNPVGFIALVGDEIGGLFLDPAVHGKGLGRSMVDHAVARRRSLRVEVFEKNEIGRRFYARYGFVEVERYRHEASGEMTLRLQLPDRFRDTD